MNLIRSITIIQICMFFGVHAMNSADIDILIEQNKNSPENLRDLLIRIAGWKVPDLVMAKKILDTSIVTANATDRGNLFEGPGYPGTTALTKAASNGKIEYVALLLDYHANIELKSPWDSRTSLMAAALDGRDETVTFLLSRGANVNAKNCSGATSLIWAAQSAHVKTVQLLLEAAADVTSKDKEGRTALSEARRALLNQVGDGRYTEIVNLLQAAGATD